MYGWFRFFNQLKMIAHKSSIDIQWFYRYLVVARLLSYCRLSQIISTHAAVSFYSSIESNVGTFHPHCWKTPIKFICSQWDTLHCVLSTHTTFRVNFIIHKCIERENVCSICKFDIFLLWNKSMAIAPL